MGKFNGCLLCSDIDGTLTRSSDGTVSEENLRAIQYFQENGGLFTLATGRAASFTAGFSFRVNAPLITVNGTVICAEDGRTVLHSFSMGDGYRDILQFVWNKAPRCQVWVISQEGESALVEQTYLSDCLPFGETVHKIVLGFFQESDALAFRAAAEPVFSGRFLWVGIPSSAQRQRALCGSFAENAAPGSGGSCSRGL